MEDSYKPRFAPTMCLTHKCNLNCIYCYQHHDNSRSMTLSTAIECIDWIFENQPINTDGIEVGFIGGEPMLEFDLIKEIIEYTMSRKFGKKFIFFASTNGTILTQDIKDWLQKNKRIFVLGLSLDGLPETHNHNRSHSFDQIDIDFFIDTWPQQGVKMTLSDYSIQHLADNIIYLHERGIHNIEGVNFCEGADNWDQEQYIQALIPELEKLVEYYVENDTIPLDQMMNKHLTLCESEHEMRKWCGIGTGTLFFDIDGKKCPCPFITPMTFNKDQLDDMCSHDFQCSELFVDKDCFDKCYLFPICPQCAGADYLVNKCFGMRDKSKCRLQKLVALYSADLQAKRLIKHPDSLDDYLKRKTIDAILKIRELYLLEFSEYTSIT